MANTELSRATRRLVRQYVAFQIVEEYGDEVRHVFPRLFAVAFPFATCALFLIAFQTSALPVVILFMGAMAVITFLKIFVVFRAVKITCRALELGAEMTKAIEACPFVRFAFLDLCLSVKVARVREIEHKLLGTRDE